MNHRKNADILYYVNLFHNIRSMEEEYENYVKKIIGFIACADYGVRCCSACRACRAGIAEPK